MANHPQGFIVAPRGDAGLRLIQSGRQGTGANAFILLYIIAQRCRYCDKNDGLKVGQCYISTHELPLTRRQTRTAISVLETTSQIATETTSQGTVVTLVNTDIFDVFGKETTSETASKTTARRPRDDQRDDHETTTNRQRNKDINKETSVSGKKSKLVFSENQKRIIRIFTPNCKFDRERDRSEQTAWKNSASKITTEDVDLIEWFYRLPKSQDCDATWNRKTSAKTLLNQWTEQVEFAQTMRANLRAAEDQQTEPIKAEPEPDGWQSIRDEFLSNPACSQSLKDGLNGRRWHELSTSHKTLILEGLRENGAE